MGFRERKKQRTQDFFRLQYGWVIRNGKRVPGPVALLRQKSVEARKKVVSRNLERMSYLRHELACNDSLDTVQTNDLVQELESLKRITPCFERELKRLGEY